MLGSDAEFPRNLLIARLFGQDDKLACLPITGPRGEVAGLSPQGSAVAIDDIHVERIIAVRAPIDTLGPAPAADDDRQDISAVEV